MINFSIRKAQSTEYEIIQDFNEKLCFESLEFDSHLDMDWPRSQEGVKYYKSLISDPHYLTLIAENEQKQSLGYLAISIKQKFVYRKIRMAELDNIYVLPEFRSQGIGSALIQKAKDILKRNGIESLYISAYIKNPKAVSFYKKIGASEIDLGLEMML